MRGDSLFIEYESEFLKAIVGPFPSRYMADEWAHQQTCGDFATWEGATVLSPEEAESKLEETRVQLRE